MVSEDEYLERIVAGIQARTTSAASVTWNDVLNGRQFDVSVRFTNGTLTYLILVEVKDRVRRASASDVEAFVTKARDQLASKAVFVTAAGFQSGAVEVARRHGIELFQVGFDAANPSLGSGQATVAVLSKGGPPKEMPFVEVGPEMLVAQIEEVTLHYKDGKTAEFPSEQTQMSYYVSNTRLPNGTSIADLINTDPIYDIAIDERQHRRVKVKKPQRITSPDEYFFKTGTLREVSFVAVGRIARSASGNVRLEPSMFRSPVVYKNVLTGEEHRFELDQLPLQFDELQVGKYYCLEHPLRYYYCEAVSGKLVTWVLVESFQCEQLFQMIFTQGKEYGAYMMPVRDKATLARLDQRLKDIRARLGSAAGG